MDEYIEREALLQDIEDSVRFTVKTGTISPEIRGANKIIDRIKCAPVADVAPVVHGKWAHLGGDEWCCSACGCVITTEGSWDKPTKKYCEDCGAKMDGGADNKQP